MIQNNINLYSKIKQTTGLSSVRIEFSRIQRFQHSFAIKSGSRKSPKRLKRTKINRQVITDDKLLFFGSILRVNSQKYFKTKSTFACSKAIIMMIVTSKNRVFAYFDILAYFRNKIKITKKHEKTKKDKNKQVSFSLMMSFILLDEHLRACSQDSSNKIKPLFNNKADHRSVISKNKVFANFDILAYFRNKKITQYQRIKHSFAIIEEETTL